MEGLTRLSNVNSDSLDDNAISALKNAIVKSTRGVKAKDITIIRIELVTNEGRRLRIRTEFHLRVTYTTAESPELLETPGRSLQTTTGNTFNVIWNVVVSLETAGYSSSTDAFNSITGQLDTATADGTFQQSLRDSNPTVFSNTTATNALFDVFVPSAAPTVAPTTKPDNSLDILSEENIILISVLGGVAVILIPLLIWFVLVKREEAREKEEEWREEKERAHASLLQKFPNLAGSPKEFNPTPIGITHSSKLLQPRASNFNLERPLKETQSVSMMESSVGSEEEETLSGNTPPEEDPADEEKLDFVVIYPENLEELKAKVKQILDLNSSLRARLKLLVRAANPKIDGLLGSSFLVFSEREILKKYGTQLEKENVKLSTRLINLVEVTESGPVDLNSLPIHPHVMPTANTMTYTDNPFLTRKKTFADLSKQYTEKGSSDWFSTVDNTEALNAIYTKEETKGPADDEEKQKIDTLFEGNRTPSFKSPKKIPSGIPPKKNSSGIPKERFSSSGESSAESSVEDSEESSSVVEMKKSVGGSDGGESDASDQW